MTPEQIEQVRRRARCVYSEAEVEAALDRLARQISDKLADSNPLLLCVLHGARIVTDKLVARLPFPVQQDTLHATRYRGATAGGELLWKAKPRTSLHNRVVLIIDDILDEGATLAKIVAWCREQQCTAVYTAVLVEKLHDHKLSAIRADFVGLQAADEYLFGYGMDYHEQLRDAAGIFAIDERDK